jgi:KDO2-lipid IV(A) lauroyltransferase
MFIAFLVLRAVVRWLPLSWAQAFGGLLGLIAYGLLGRYRSLAWEHLAVAFGPSLRVTTRHRIARHTFLNLGKTVMEWLVLDRCSPARIRRMVEIHGLAHLDQALAKGRGVIALSAHFGNWELLAIALVSLGYDGGVLARRLRYPEYEDMLWAMRRRNGVATIARGSVKDVAEWLRKNQIIGMLPDQDIDSLDGIFVEFFDRPAYTPVGPAASALMTGAPIIPCFLIRADRRFRIMIEEPIAMSRTGDRTQDLVAITQRWSRVVESYIRRSPDQWVWMHRRWKTQPATTDDRGQRTGDRPIVASKRREVEPTLSCLLSSVFCLLCSVFLGCAKPAVPSAQTPAAVDTPSSTGPAAASQQMGSFTMVGYAADGSKRWELEGQGASIEQAIVTVRQPRGVGYDVSAAPAAQAGPPRTASVSASLAQVEQTSRRVRLEHDVIIHTSDGLWLTSPTMYWLPDRDELVTDDSVRVESADLLLRGRGATGHSELKRAVVLHDVELVLNPTTHPPAEIGEGQAGEGPGTRSHVTITCEGPLSFDYERNIATFERHVHVRDAQGDLYSDTLIAYVDGTARTLTYAQASGNVRVAQGLHRAQGARAVYEPATSKVTLLGLPSLLVSRER